MLTRHKKWLLTLFQQVNELRADPLNQRLLALEIQEQLLQRIGRAERLIRRIRSENKLIKKTLAQRDTSVMLPARQKPVISQGKSGKSSSER
jgi:hypothetical protein